MQPSQKEFRYRTDRKGRLILQIEVGYIDIDLDRRENWRDAKVSDITEGLQITDLSKVKFV